MLSTDSKIFTPIKIGEIEVKNRIAMAPMANLGLTNPDGSPGKRFIDYFLERARGGTGLLITGAFRVETKVEEMAGVPHISHAALRPLAELSEAVHAFGSKIFVQLTAGFGRVAHPEAIRQQPVSASPNPNYWKPTVICRELEKKEVEHIVSSCAEAAKICSWAGVDGVEIHAVHEGYLLDQFAIEFFNRRTDKYGGNLQNRLRFATEILQEIKKKAGDDFPVIIRYSVKSYIKDLNQGGLPGEEFIEKGRDSEEGLEVAKLLEKAGYDAFDADAGSYDAWYWAHPPNYQVPGCYLPFTEALKKVVTVPVIVAGRLDLPELAEKTLREGTAADMIAIGRGLLADPYWVGKLNERRTDRIRPCLGCHDGCLGRVFRGRPLSCAVNPAAGRESDYGIKLADKRKRVVIVGGGVSGLEAARVASLRGHEVSVYEKSDTLGGHLNAASVPGFKKDVARLLAWYENEIEELGVTIKREFEAMPETIEEEQADVVVIATGSRPIIPNIRGIRDSKVMTAIDVLLGKKEIGGENVVVVGGGLIGCETALWLADSGKKVSIVEMLDALLQSKIPIPRANKTMILDLLRFKGVASITGQLLHEVTDEGAVLTDKNGTKTDIKGDAVVLSIGLQSNSDLYQSLIGRVPHLYRIGDAREAGNIMSSIWDAYEIARVI